MTRRIHGLAMSLGLLVAACSFGGGSSSSGGGEAPTNALPEQATFQFAPLSDSCSHTIEFKIQFGKQFGGQKLVVKLDGPGLPTSFDSKVPPDGGAIVQDWHISLPGAWKVVSATLNGLPVGGVDGLHAANPNSSCWIPSQLSWTFAPGTGCGRILNLIITWSNAPSVPFVLNLSGPGIPATFTGTIPAGGTPITQNFPVTGPGAWTIVSLGENGEPPRPQSIQSTITSC